MGTRGGREGQGEEEEFRTNPKKVAAYLVLPRLADASRLPGSGTKAGSVDIPGILFG